MIYLGMIATYDGETQRGTIQPNAGGDPLAFRLVDLHEQAEPPCQADYFSYETWMTDDGEETAVHLRQIIHI